MEEELRWAPLTYLIDVNYPGLVVIVICLHGSQEEVDTWEDQVDQEDHQVVDLPRCYRESLFHYVEVQTEHLEIPSHHCYL